MTRSLPPFAPAVAPAPRLRRSAALLWGTVRAVLSFLETDERLEALKCAVYRRVPL